MSFKDRSTAVATSFLQSVVVFDDQAEMESGHGPATDTDTGATDINDDDAADGFGQTPTTLSAPTATSDLTSDETGISVKRLSDAFAAKGLICGVLKPTPEDADSEARLVVEAARRADIVILDWVIERDEGEVARGIITEILSSDRDSEEERLRLIAIYTSQADLDSIAAQLAETLGDLHGSPPEVDAYTLTSRSARIVVLAKESSNAVGDAAMQRIREDALPQRLIEIFAEFTTGLVPNVVLAGLAAVRSDTHRVLQVLDSRLDSAYIGHRLLIDDAGEAEEQLVGLLTSELRAVMEDREIGAHAGSAAVRDWVTAATDAEPFSAWAAVPTEQAQAEIQALLDQGILGSESPVPEFRSRTQISKAKAHTEAARLFARNESEADHANDDLAMTFVLRTHYSNPARALQLGTIIEAEGNYLLCVQPVCDSLRIDDPRDFPFLPLARDSAQFDLVLRNEDGRTPLRLEHKPHKVTVRRFEPDADLRCVIAHKDADHYTFTDTSGQSFRWAGRLHEDHAQRVAHRLGTGFSRVGLSESEWLRKVSRQDDQ